MTFETIDTTRLMHLPVYRLPPTYHLQKDSGNGCFMDPPGYPTYFTRSICTQVGNNPPHTRPQQVISYQGTLYVTQSGADWKGCGDHDAYMAKINKRMRLLYKPLPLDHPRVQSWIRAEFAYFRNCYVDMRKPEAIRKNVAELAILEAAPLDFHRATIDVQEIYPEFVPTTEHTNVQDRDGNWWETEAVKPTPETCKPRGIGPHPINGTWCQWCGWRAEAA